MGRGGRGPTPSSFKVPVLHQGALAFSLAHARAFNKRPCSWPLPYGLVESRLGVFRFCRLISRRTGLFVRYAFRQSLTICNALRLAGVFP